jgi:hypothetical protein
MAPSMSYPSPDAGNKRSPVQSTAEASAAEKRSRHTTEVMYAAFALAVAILFFATTF